MGGGASSHHQQAAPATRRRTHSVHEGPGRVPAKAQPQQVSSSAAAATSKVVVVAAAPPGRERRSLGLAEDYSEQQAARLGVNSRQRKAAGGADSTAPAVVFRASGDGRLDLSDQGFVEVPPVVFGLARLVELDLSSNFIEELPERMGDAAASLEVLVLAGNRIRELPASMCKLTKLRMLHLADNLIGELPEGVFSCLTQLVELHVEYNQLTRLPPLGEHTRLVGLSADGNRFGEPGAISSLPSSLEILHLNGTGLAEFPPSIASCTELKELGLSENRIRELPPEILALHSLEELFLSCNSLSSLPEGFGGQLLLLCKLDLSYNDIDEFPAEVTALPNLEKLNISGNRVCLASDGSCDRRAPFGIDTGSTKVYWQFPLPDRIEDGLFLGGVESSRNKTGLKRLGITHIVSAGISEPLYPDQFRYLSLRVEDNSSTDILVHFQDVIRFILGATTSGASPAASVLVHCETGDSTSAALVIAFLMATKRWNLKQAFTMVRSKRHSVLPNDRFLQQLQLFEQQLAIGRVLLDTVPTSAFAADLQQTLATKHHH